MGNKGGRLAGAFMKLAPWISCGKSINIAPLEWLPSEKLRAEDKQVLKFKLELMNGHINGYENLNLEVNGGKVIRQGYTKKKLHLEL